MDTKTKIPVLFVGHGSPMNAIEDNRFSRKWSELALKIPKPRAVLCISAHWESDACLVTSAAEPETIHDFGGFPDELYQVKYAAPGSKWLCRRVREIVKSIPVQEDPERGLDHGAWSVLKRMYPLADIPVVQLSLDRKLTPAEHFKLGKELAVLRSENVLILGSGNLVHNLWLVSWETGDLNTPFGFDWALEANDIFKKLIRERDFKSLGNYPQLGKSVQLAIPTPEHYLPALYILALLDEQEQLEFFNDEAVGGSLTMTSFISV